MFKLFFIFHCVVVVGLGQTTEVNLTNATLIISPAPFPRLTNAIVKRFLYYEVIEAGLNLSKQQDFGTNASIANQCVKELEQILNGISDQELFAVKGRYWCMV